MRNLFAPMTLALPLALLSGCVSTPGIPDPSERLPSQTVLYIEQIASGDRFEIESGRIALERSQIPAVRDFAARMIAAHSAMSDDLRAATETVRPASPAFALISHHFAMLEQLRQAGPEFDQIYRDDQVTVHQEALALHRDYAATGRVVALEALARAAIAVTEAHLQEARQLPVPPTPVPAAPMAPVPPVPAPRQAGERG